MAEHATPYAQPATMCRSNQRAVWSAAAVGLMTVAALMFYSLLYVQLPSSLLLAGAPAAAIQYGFQPNVVHPTRFPLLESWSLQPPLSAAGQRLLSVHWVDINDDFCPDALLLSASQAAPSAATVSVFYLLNACDTSQSPDAFRTPSHHALTLEVDVDPGADRLLSALVADMNRDYTMDLTLLLSHTPPSTRSSAPTALHLSSLLVRSSDSPLAVYVIDSEPSVRRAAQSPATSHPQRADSSRDLSHQTTAASTEVKPLSVRSGPPLLAMDWDTNALLELLLRDPASNSTTYQSVPSAAFQPPAGDGAATAMTAASQPLLDSLRPIPVWEAPFPCVVLAFALLEADVSPKLLCLGEQFPRDVRIFHHDRWTRVFQDVTATLQPVALPTTAASIAHTIAFTVQDACMGDFNHDGRADYVLASQDQGVVLWLSTSTPQSSNADSPNGYHYTVTLLRPPDAAVAARERVEVGDRQQPQSATRVCCIDFDNDGDLDIFALYAAPDYSTSPSNDTPRPALNGVFLNNDGQLQFAYSLTDPTGGAVQADTAVAADYDGDGLVDLMLASSAGATQLQLFRNDEASHQTDASNAHWLEVTLHGTEWSNSMARGATVQVVADGGKFQLTRVAMETSSSGSAGVYGQHHQRLHFGLGTRSIIEKLYIFWPDTEPQVYDSVAVDQHVHIIEAENTLPPPLRRSLAGYHFKDGGCAVPGQQRLKPSVFILGQWKCGTTSLAASLAQHPLILPATRKELHYFMLPNQSLPLAWYAQQFPCGFSIAGQLTFEASASYFFYPSAPQLLIAYPDAKLIVLLRDPVRRAFSHYRMSMREQATTGSSDAFHDQMAFEMSVFKLCVFNHQLATATNHTAEMDDTADVSTAPMSVLSRCAEDYSIITSGLYAVLFSRWTDALPADRCASQLLVIDSDALFSQQAVLRSVFDFIGVAPLDITIERQNSATDWVNDKGASDMRADTAYMLRAFFRPFNDMLWRTVGFDNGHKPSWIDYTPDIEPHNATLVK